MPADPRQRWWRDLLELLRPPGGAPDDRDRARPKAVRRLDRLSADLDRLQGRYGDPADRKEKP